MPSPSMARPDASEHAPYYGKYIQLVPEMDIVRVMTLQIEKTLGFLRALRNSAGDKRYAPDKWTIKEVVGHLSDSERVFAQRALFFARSIPIPLPSFEQEIAVAAAGSDDVSWARHVEEFAAVRTATTAFFRDLPDAAWSRKGIASGNPFTVRAFAWIAAGHVEHHIGVLKDRYL